MYAQLGSIQFRKLIGFDQWGRDIEAVYAKKDLLYAKSNIAGTGFEPDSLKIGIQFHVSFCHPETEIARMESALKNMTILPLIIGNGRFIGNFVIKKISESILQTSDKGDITVARLGLELLEFDIKDKAEANTLAAQNSAVALAENQPVTIRGLPKDYRTEAGNVTKAINEANSQAKKANDLVKQARSVQEWIAHNSAKITSSMDAATTALGVAQSLMNGSSVLTTLAPFLPAQLVSAIAAATNLKTAMPITDINAVLSLSNTFQSAMNQTKLYNAPLSGGLISRIL